MNAPASFNTPFFITRYSANLMEDLQRQISTAGAICLVYGTEGTGKTRLIRQFISTRLAGRKIKYCTLVSDGFFLDDDTQLYAFENIVPALLKTAPSNSMWVIDQLELAPNGFIQQLLDFWSLHASKLNCALILGCRPMPLGTVYKISELLNLKIPSVELKPFTDKESLQYLSAQLCSNMDATPILSRELKKQLKLAGGVPGQLSHIIQQHSGLIECTQRSPDNNNKKAPYLLVSVMIILSLGIYLNSLNYDPSEGSSIQKTEENKITPPQASKVPQYMDSTTPEILAPVVLAGEDLAEDAMELEPAFSGGANKIETIIDEQPQTTANSVSDPEKEEQEREPILTPQNVLEERLLATEEWLRLSPDNSASIQIMSLGLGKQPEKSLTGFLVNLSRNGTDLKKIYIYQMNKASDHIYVVLFGSYTDRASARLQIESLPSLLKANSPIVRTVQGIKNEIMKSESSAGYSVH